MLKGVESKIYVSLRVMGVRRSKVIYAVGCNLGNISMNNNKKKVYKDYTKWCSK